VTKIDDMVNFLGSYPLSFGNSGIKPPATMVLAAGFYLGSSGIYVVISVMLDQLGPAGPSCILARKWR
jgi:hypothetical protein